MTDFQQQLIKYADLAVRIGVNVHPGQTLVVNAPISSAEFVRLIVKQAYEAGAKLVKVNWSDEIVTRLQYELAADEAFTIVPTWYAGEIIELVENGAAVLSVLAENPDLLKGIPQERIATAQKTRGQALKKYREYVQSDKFSWSIVAVPSVEWAAAVFPDLPQNEQVQKLWEAIFHTVRVDQDNPVEAWQTHLENLSTKSSYLNAKKYKKLHYIAPGTDLVIELPVGHIWAAGESTDEQGHHFVANMPTEEVFTAPLKTGVNGTVSSTKPLSYGGNIIDNFSVTFENGRIISVSAEQGQETLEHLVAMDEGSHYLGEVALVPHQSPISESNILYYNTLFDENASNHLAIGSAYAFCLEGGKDMTQEELLERGLNTSITHVDFMIGSAQMDINGITEDGQEEPLFRNGNWAI
ncbi:aminopeptidase [Paenibacillus macquariensis]|uniref:Aminopeptidase n=1 Tax=Paenibacillus macquariensis TaxID=948756 RepID=A0ABY1K7E8_9BACL|nr:aminopeptidase [Paenibacillus macquariensis]MEC0091077.1 aminopeptidase [Paenibacillus macquariensis]OAB33734.1 peptidase M29 [Paenibacillus macquariensis subsp. macquariensis]SIR37002.1 aminopeptidase [Paenibacillus macquariensis]